MSKRVVDREKIKEDLNSLVNKAALKIVLSAVVCVLATVFLVLAIIFIKSVIDPEAKTVWLIILAVFYCIILIAYPLYRFICGVYLVINLKIKIVFDKFSVTEDEIASRNACEPIGLKERFKPLPSIKTYQWLCSAVYLKSYGRYIVTNSEDDGHLRYASSDSKLYVVLVKGFKEPMLVYTHMMYDYAKENYVD